MTRRLLHIFRNTPFGRETLMQSAHFCKQMGCELVIYIPESNQFLMYFSNDAVQVDLDKAFLRAPASARAHATEIAAQAGLQPAFMTPKFQTAHGLPDIPTNYDFMCCPRSISDLSTKIGLGYIGPKVRRIVAAAQFPVLITSPVHKPWQSIMVFFGGSANAVKALRLGLLMQQTTGLPLDIFTQQRKKSRAHYETIIADSGLEDRVGHQVRNWQFHRKGKLIENLYEVPHDALVVLGAYGHGLIKEMLFGSMMEKVQSTISNNMLIVGPNCEASG